MKRNRASASFMTRLGRDQRGNTIAIVAAAIVPLLGMIGGGIDMSRLYLAKTRLQQACDAGALAGRKAMGSGTDFTHAASGPTPQDRSNELFQANFANGAYGTTLVGREFSQDEEGVVKGEATVAVPMSVMKIFGMTTRSISVECTAKMEIPNTDVMFVLDVTGSMNCPTSGNCPGGNNGDVPAKNAKIFGLKSAVKCFYEALQRVNTAEVCGNDDPTATTYAGTAQIRIGFMPYSVNVNVGKLLNNNWLADSWNYHTRRAQTEPAYAWTAGTESAMSWPAGWSSPPNLSNAATYSGWQTTSGSVTIDGTNYPRYRTATISTICTSPNTQKAGSSVIGYANPGTLKNPTTPDTYGAPVNPQQTQTRKYSQSDDYKATAYKYTWISTSSNKCQLQVSAILSYSLTRTNGQTTRDISWKTYPKFLKWIYEQRSINVAGLKTGGANWAASISLPLNTADTNVKLSGSNSSSSLTYLTDKTVTWDGCIEERKTVKNSDRDPSNEWASIPTDAYDLNIDMIPSSSVADSHWGPMLPGAVWGRFTETVDRRGNKVSTNSFSKVETTDNLDQNMDYFCSTEAKKLQPWNTPTGFENYVDSLNAIGNTYHDIGLIWGARFISPTGIFAEDNAETSTGGAIQRHIIFMTDGDTMTSNINYTAHGIHWWDRRQTTYEPSSTNLNNILNARLSALCRAIKARNITLWVISYGQGTNTETKNRLTACATEGKYFSALDTPTLISNFKQIAAKIAELRLTS